MSHDNKKRLDDAKQMLDAVDQQHVLHFYDQLDHASQTQLLDQIESVDWAEVAGLVESHVKQKPELKLADNVEPAPWYPHRPTEELKDTYKKARDRGDQLIAEGKIAPFTVAGGQGTRLGWDAPKGTFPATPIRGLPLFAVFAEYIINIERRYKTKLPWYIMTSPINDKATRDYFKENDYFHLDQDYVKIFPQAMLPAIDIHSGKVLLAEQDSLALSPNGHGGSLKALHTHGCLDDMASRGIEQISYLQVDNPLVRVVDPLFIGLHDNEGAQMSSKMLPKASPKEKLGNFCLVDGKMTVIEYSDLPDELAYETTPDGGLRFRAGSIAIHVIRRDFIESLNASERFALPFHRAEKKVAYVDLDSGETVSPHQPNAVKLETFVFDALPLCEKSIVYETDRVEEFAPIKNADTAEGHEPAVDSPQTSKQLQTERAARWLETRGVKIPRDDQGNVDAILEISQATAIYPEDLADEDLPNEIDPGAELLL